MTFFVFIFLQSLFAFDCEPIQKIEFKTIKPGLQWAKYDLKFTPYNKEMNQWEKELNRSVTVRALKIQHSQFKLKFIPRAQSLTCNPKNEKYIKNLIHHSQQNVLAAINASFFVMPNGPILGIAKDEDQIYSQEIDTQTIKSSGVMFLDKNQWKLLPRLEFKNENLALENLSFAVQAYPILINKDKLVIGDGVLNHKRSRTSIGINDQNELLLVTIDARGESLNTGMTLFEYANFLHLKKCGLKQEMSLNLDGGGSTAFAIPSENIYEQADKCRSLGNLLTVQ